MVNNLIEDTKMCKEKICEIILKSLNKGDKKKIEEETTKEIFRLNLEIQRAKLTLEDYYKYCISEVVPLGSYYSREDGTHFRVPPSPDSLTIMYTSYVPTAKIQNRIHELFESIRNKKEEIKQLEELVGW